MNFEEKYPNLDSIFGFLNQDWHHIYKWEHRKPQYQPVLRLAKKAESDELTYHQAIMELRDLLEFGKDFDDEEWYDFFMNSSSSLGYYPPGDKLNYKEWLVDVLSILEEPMEETKKHFIPEFIG